MPGRFIVGILVILIGLSFLLNFPFFKIAFALLIIYFGLKIISGEPRHFPARVGKVSQEEDDDINRVLIFAAMNKKYVSKNFKAGDLVTIFGRAQIDLSDVKSESDAIEFSAVAIFGGVEIKFPPNWEVKTEGVGILGSFDNNSVKPPKVVTKVIVKGAAIFGAVELTS